MPRKIKPRYGIDPVQVVRAFFFTDAQIVRLLDALPKAKGNPAGFLARLQHFARLYVWLRKQWQDKPSRAEQNAALAEIAELAGQLAQKLPALDIDSQIELLDGAALPAAVLPDIVDRIEVIGHGASQALRAGQQQTGRRSDPCLRRVMPDLARLYEQATGIPFTHNPNQLTEYKGSPQSLAGRFVTAFFAIVDPAVPDTLVSTAMASFVKTRAAMATAPLKLFHPEMRGE